MLYIDVISIIVNNNIIKIKQMYFEVVNDYCKLCKTIFVNLVSINLLV
jgi:hypothetical protein